MGSGDPSGLQNRRELALLALVSSTLTRFRQHCMSSFDCAPQEKGKPMAENADCSTDLQTSGGFRIEITPVGLTVEKAAETQTLWIYLIYAVIFCYFFYALVSVGRPASFLLLLPLAVGVIQYWFVGIHNLRCTRENIEVIDVIRGRTRRVRSYPRDSVKGIRYGGVSFSMYSSICGLILEVEGKPVKTLYGLKCVEAKKILDELQRLGFNVCHDPAMPMMVEMEQSRRKSWLGFP